jgi:hypothetical protein
MSRAAKREQWTALVDEWRQSGLSQKAFCQQRQLNLHSLQYWRKILAQSESSETHSEKDNGFIPLFLAEPAVTEVRIALSNQFKLEVPLASLSSVLTHLKQAGWL